MLLKLGFFKKMVEGEKGIVEFEHDGNKYILVYSPVKNMNWSLGVIVPEPNMKSFVEENRLNLRRCVHKEKVL